MNRLLPEPSRPGFVDCYAARFDGHGPEGSEAYARVIRPSFDFDIPQDARHLPFSARAEVCFLPDIVASLENGLSDIENGAGRFPQVAGLKFSFDKTKPSGARLVGDVLVEENGAWAQIDPAKVYGVVTNNFMRNGGDGYALFSTNGQNAYDFGPPLEDVLADFIANMGGVYTPYTDGRISDVSPAS